MSAATQRDPDAQVLGEGHGQHVCLECGALWDRPTLCPFNGADAPTYPVGEVAAMWMDEAHLGRIMTATLKIIATAPDPRIASIATNMLEHVREERERFTASRAD